MLIEPSKMANVAAICTALGRLGFSVTAAAFITDQQQMETLEELEVLTDSEVENLCKVCHRPGGLFPIQMLVWLDSPIPFQTLD